MANVFEQGFLALGITLAARLQETPTWFLTNLGGLSGDRKAFFFYVPGTGAFGAGLTPVPDPTGPFPYGRPVEDP